jgi:hypothetical protein
MAATTPGSAIARRLHWDGDGMATGRFWSDGRELGDKLTLGEDLPGILEPISRPVRGAFDNGDIS